MVNATPRPRIIPGPVPDSPNPPWAIVCQNCNESSCPDNVYFWVFNCGHVYCDVSS